MKESLPCEVTSSSGALDYTLKGLGFWLVMMGVTEAIPCEVTSSI